MSSWLHIGTSSQKGSSHKTNDDAVFYMDSGVLGSLGALSIICDGVSSVPHGKWAAEATCEKMEDFFANISLKNSIEDFCDEIDKISQIINKTPKKRGACTLSMCWIQAGKLHSFWLGDTQIAILRNRNLHIITNERQKSGQVRYFMGMNVSIRAGLATKSTILEDNDIILIMSDGVSEIVSKNDLYVVWKHCYEDPQLCAEKLVQLAHFSGSTDDNSVIVMHYQEDG